MWALGQLGIAASWKNILNAVCKQKEKKITNYTNVNK